VKLEKRLTALAAMSPYDIQDESGEVQPWLDYITIEVHEITESLREEYVAQRLYSIALEDMDNVTNT